MTDQTRCAPSSSIPKLNAWMTLDEAQIKQAITLYLRACNIEAEAISFETSASLQANVQITNTNISRPVRRSGVEL